MANLFLRDSLLENAGFKLLPGQLEVFPNPKPYIVEGAPSLFNAHRLPLQAGSYLLNSAFETIRSSPEQFVEQWHWAQQKNCLDEKTLRRIIQQAKRRCFRISGKADKFINDLNAEIEPGWTDFGRPITYWEESPCGNISSITSWKAGLR